jgi:lipid A disaccharide synthetase
LKAQQYLSAIPFSRQGLIDQLVQFEGYPLLDATYGVDALSANWNEQAAKKAEQYLSVMPFSRQGLIEQLVNFEGFTTEQAEYGVRQTGL